MSNTNLRHEGWTEWKNISITESIQDLTIVLPALQRIISINDTFLTPARLLLLRTFSGRHLLACF